MTTSRRDGLTETPFRQWTRHNPRLDSGIGFASMDIDNVVFHIWHQFMGLDGSRQTNRILLIEEKSNGAELGFSEMDTMYILDQIIRLGIGGTFQRLKGQRVQIDQIGYYILKYNGRTLRDSTEILWGRPSQELSGGHLSRIELRHLEWILRFEIDPDPASWQRARKQAH